MFTAIIGTIIDSVIKYAFGYFSDLAAKRGLIQQGQAQQAAADTAATEAAESRIAAAEANAPATKNAALDRLEKGSA